jgi:hypothetical protein
MGAEVYPDEGYVHRLESGIISWPHHNCRTMLEKLCGRPARELGFSPSARSGSKTASSRVNVEFRDAVWGSGMEISRLARMVGVAPKTAERWITLGRTPRPLHRWKHPGNAPTGVLPFLDLLIGHVPDQAFRRACWLVPVSSI